MANLELKNIHIHYDDFHAVKGVDITIGDGEIVTLLGPSGCGKTSILRAIAGFIKPSSGGIILNESNITMVPPQKRDMGMIFQNYALWPHMTVRQNIGYGLRVRNVDKDVIEKKIDDLVKQVQLEGHDDKFPGQLSGGQQQRVALARALAISPTVLLCDEPLSNLDFKLRVELRTEIRDVAKKFGVTVAYVTHDQTEALAISDKIAVINYGELIQLGSPIEIFSNPNSHFVGRFVGENNLLEGELVAYSDGIARIALDSGDIITQKLEPSDQITKMLDEEDETSSRVKLIIRHDNLTWTQKTGDNRLAGKLKHKAYMGHFLQIEIELADGSMVMANITESIPELVDQALGSDFVLEVADNSWLVFDSAEKRIY